MHTALEKMAASNIPKCKVSPLSDTLGHDHLQYQLAQLSGQIIQAEGEDQCLQTITTDGASSILGLSKS